jgi:flagellar protein FliS
MQNPYQKYMQQSVSTMTPGQLIVALYDKCILELNKAIYYIEEKDIPKAHNSITRVSDIVDTLDGHLKVKYEISTNLASLYQFFRENLIKANVKKDTEILKMLIPFFTELKEAFEEISRKGY